MKVKILGCSGSETIGHMPPGFLVNEVLMLDAGTITAALSIEAQSKITDILISHTHLDHIKSLLFLADNIIGRIKKPVNIRAIPKVIDAIRKHLMNDLIWPDFTRIPTPKNPVLAYAPMPVNKTVSIAGLKVKAIPMNHPVPAVGFLVSDGKSSFLYSADTGPNEGLWKEAAKAKNLSAIIVDTSFPNSLDGIATLSGHFTPGQLHRDLAKARVANDVPIYIYHVKPVHKKKVISELKGLGRKNVKILVEGKTYHF
ncbi:MAG: 3',5'-cyclic-nucleotide phosphodiesterase [Nitrospiraceae bacterium]|nr:3',5'-cyclic-nucleotide phosphodiesterase [Nitrospiraceae bacterium]